MALIETAKMVLPHAFYLSVRALVARRRRSLSQLGQDVWVMGEVFDGKRGGYFVEIGMADGLTFSNTYLLERRLGWRGLCIEGNPAFMEDIRRVRSVDCVNACLDEEEGEASFAQRDVLGGIIADDTDNASNEAKDVNVIRVRTRTLASILREHRAPQTIDYLSIDIEGAEDRVLLRFPFDEYTVRSMTVERPKPPLRAKLADIGFITVREIPRHDVFYIHRSFLQEYEHNLWAFWTRFARS